MEFGERLKLLRGTLRQDEFASEVGFHKNTIGRWERGEQTPNVEDLNRILERYPDINPTWLLTGEGEMKDNWRPLSSVNTEHKKDCQKLLLAVLEGIEDAHKLAWYDLSIMTPKERTALVYTLFTLFSEDKLKHLANKEFIASQSGFVYLLIKEHKTFTKKHANIKLTMKMAHVSDELNLFGKSVEILNEYLIEDNDKSDKGGGTK